MANKMLIDAAHPEETRVVVLRGKRVEEFDYESAARKQLRGNIYLAKVTRVEPSLQAAFVDYGGNRHGFLAFSEIHPDYYQIPVADRQALLEEEALAEAEEAELEDFRSSRGQYEDEEPSGGADSSSFEIDEDDEDEDSEQAERRPPGNIALELEARQEFLTEEPRRSEENDPGNGGDVVKDGSADTGVGAEIETAADAAHDKNAGDSEPSITSIAADDEEAQDSFVEEPNDIVQEITSFRGRGEDEDELDDSVESVGSEDALEELPQRPRRRRRVYKIQEVIRRRQIILVQVVKEERGNKGAALTTYLSLAGRHTVLMPNTARGGGISRKITNPADRKRLRKIAGELEIPEGTGLIIRTAGASRTKAEIKRDYEYLLRLWENVRDLTMQSTAPAVVYEEGDLIKRSIRDLYSKEIEEVLVAGDDAYKDAKNFMRMIMPSHAKNVKLYKESEPLFIRHQIERQLNEMYSPYVTLPAGGYIVINQTEALVSIDVNSGKSTKEHSIEDTALRTNLEAAEEIARQLRLRDLAGLVVIDFIDMDERRNNRAVERKLKECLRNDRARIQVGRISHFGLLEMSRQRLRTGVLEGSTTQCPHCQGTGIIRSTDSVSLSVLRALEDTLLAGDAVDLTAITSVDVALYVLNQKRPYLKDIEARYSVNISIVADQKLQGANFQIERTENPDGERSEKNVVVKVDWGFEPPEGKPAKTEDEDSRKRRKRKRRRKDRNDPVEASDAYEDSIEEIDDLSDSADEDGSQQASDSEDKDGSERRSRTRRRGRRGGRRHRSTSQKRDDSDSSLPDDDIASENQPGSSISDDEAVHTATSEPFGNEPEDSENENRDAGDDQSRENRGRSRRRFPAGRRRSSRRRGGQPETGGNRDSTDISSMEPSAINEKSDQGKARSREHPVSGKSAENVSEIKAASSTESRGDAKQSVSITINSADERPGRQDKSPEKSNLEPASDAPARKGWWQKKAQ